MTAQHSLQSDSPLTDPQNDALGYAPFAEHLAKALAYMIPGESMVLAVNGPWGSGKTTVLNFVQNYLEEVPPEKRPITIFFNPWWYADQEDLTRQFFAQFYAQLEGVDISGLKKSISQFADAISDVPIPVVAGFASVARIFGREMSLPKLKAEISQLLRKHGRQILITMDDIDRLSATEIRRLFRLVKATADFPNVIYLLAFDQNIVVRALEEEQGVPGQDYLEKIVQASYELPLPDKMGLRKMLFDRLDSILDQAGTPEELFDSGRWANVYYQGVDDFVTTPRHVVRLSNALRLTYGAVAGEVNPIDFIAIEALRVFCPFVYNEVRQNRDLFLFADSVPGLLRARAHADERRRYFEDFISQFPDPHTDHIQWLLANLFPSASGFLGRGGHAAYEDSSWRRLRRICSPDVFDTYFRLSPPEAGITYAQMQAYLSTAADVDEFIALLRRLARQRRPDRTSRVSVFMEELTDYIEEIPIEYIPSVVTAFLSVGDELHIPEDRPEDPFYILHTGIRIAQIVSSLLLRLEEPGRYQVLRQGLQTSQSIYTIVNTTSYLNYEHGKHVDREPRPETDRLLTREHVDELEALTLRRIRHAAQEDVLQNAPHLLEILYRWSDWVQDDDEIRAWLEHLVTERGLVLTVLEAFLRESRVHTSSDVTVRREYGIDLEALSSFIDPSLAIAHLASIENYEDLTDRQRIAAGELIGAYGNGIASQTPESTSEQAA